VLAALVSGATYRRLLLEALSQSTSRMVLLYIGLKFAFMQLQFWYGTYTSNMAVVTDSFHTAFDLCALLAALLAILYARRQPDAQYSYGYQRFEVIAGFSNAIFLIFVALFVVMEAFHDLYKPPELHSEGIGMALVGLLVDVSGLGLFSRYRSLRSVQGRKFPMASSKADDSFRNDSHFYNLHGVFLHALCDFASHIGLIFADWLTVTHGWSMSNGLIFCAVAIVMIRSAYPLFHQMALVLLQTAPAHIHAGIQKSLREISFHDGVLECRSAHWWVQSPGVVIGSLHVRVRGDANEQEVLNYANSLLGQFVTHLTIQVEKDEPLGWKS
jgi:cation diffusion facilitator family transporter